MIRFVVSIEADQRRRLVQENATVVGAKAQSTIVALQRAFVVLLSDACVPFVEELRC